MDVALEKYNAKRIYGIPAGLKELMVDISREVLRAQPVHLCLFIANYLDALIDARDCCKAARNAVDNAIVYGELLVKVTKKYGIDVKSADAAATKIQATYRGYITRQHLLRKGLLGGRRQKQTECLAL
ncbi:uncharacterized protein LOC124153394 isoform X2 [Ischnura elegans]|uniref:uncharacterized protein LOC124153394 isoform X2 n=1 Tax=Ischnura elegans TaxID=197161 RepID=UPI001ED8A7E4|nr:uncharacterized protein LOC124153394 isoform X2 [Ischnura elegans]